MIEKTSFHHVKRGMFERFLQIYQGQFQKLIPRSYGVDPNSQAAYELHARGVVRPGDLSMPMIYRLSLLDFFPPYFTLEIQCINETGKFLLKIFNDVSEDLKSAAVVTRIRRVQWGCFSLDHALLKKHWNAENIAQAISYCGPAITKELEMTNDPWIRPVKVGLDDPPHLTADPQRISTGSISSKLFDLSEPDKISSSNKKILK